MSATIAAAGARLDSSMIEMRSISKRFVRRLDYAERIAARFGARYEERTIRAVDGVSLVVGEREVLGLVGESGCGKSTLGRVASGLLEPTEGSVWYRGRDVSGLAGAEARHVMLNRQMIFQDPFATLNPRIRIGDAIGEAPLFHGLASRADLDGYVAVLMQKVGLDPSLRDRYPHQFSGGQRQRIGIARALAVRPEFLVCDEPVAALDVSIQAQILNLFVTLREQLGLTSLFISHDLGVVHHLSDRVAIMYLGRIVETAATPELFARPNHPYTQALLEEIPRIDKRHSTYTPVRGEIPSPLDPPSGCPFHPRCPHAGDRCRSEAPVLRKISVDHFSACHLNEG